MIFQGFSLDIEAGISIALVGRSGFGKSTIIRLIQRFNDAPKGVVKTNSRDIITFQLRSLRKYIGVDSQESNLFSGA